MWKIGQKVWCILRGPGVVEDVTNNHVIVNFGSKYTKNLIYFGLDGKMSPKFKRSLYFSEPKIDAAEKPPFTKTLKKGDLIVVQSKKNCILHALVVEEEFPDWVEMQSGSVYHKITHDFFRVAAAKIEFN